MNVETIAKILKRHNIDFKIINENIYAKENYTKPGFYENGEVVSGFKWINVTNFDKSTLYEWLGY